MGVAKAASTAMKAGPVTISGVIIVVVVIAINAAIVTSHRDQRRRKARVEVNAAVVVSASCRGTRSEAWLCVHDVMKLRCVSRIIEDDKSHAEGTSVATEGFTQRASGRQVNE